MKSIIIYFILLALPYIGHACTESKVIDDGSVSITPDKDMSSGIYHVRAPEKYNGAKLEVLVLSAYNGVNEISLPLPIKSKGKITGIYFYMSSQWLNIRISASYKGLQCTELIAKLTM